MNLNKKVFIGLLSLLISSFSLADELLLKNAKIHTATDRGTIEKADILIRDGKIISAVQEERFTRIKHDAAFPKNALIYILREAKLNLDEIDKVVFFEKPFS